MKKILKDGSWRKGAFYDGWNEYNIEVRHVFDSYKDFVPYEELKALAELIRQIPLSRAEQRFGTQRNEEADAVLELLLASEEVNTPASNAAAQMTVAYPNQASAVGIRDVAQEMRGNPLGGFFRMGYTWSWKAM